MTGFAAKAGYRLFLATVVLLPYLRSVITVAVLVAMYSTMFQSVSDSDCSDGCGDGEG